jgi:hypothetical protein
MAKRRLNHKRYHQLNNPSHSGGGMGSIVGIAALGIGAYLLYEWWISAASTNTTASTSTATATPVVTSAVPTSTSPNTAVVATSPTSNAVSTTVASPTPVPVVIPQAAPPYIQTSSDPVVQQALTLVQILEQTAGVNANTAMTSDQWSYYYQQLRGVIISPQQYSVIIQNLNNQFPGNAITGNSMMTATEFVQGLTSVGLTGLSNTATNKLNPSISNQAAVQNAPYGSHAPGRPFRETQPVMRPSGHGMAGFGGLGRTYMSGYHGVFINHDGVPGMSGLGIIGEGYNINETTYGGATQYELADKWVM